MSLTVWIEGESFQDARTGWGDGHDASLASIAKALVYEDPGASGGKLLVAFQKPGQWCGYHAPICEDGLFALDLWVRYATIAPRTRVRFLVNGENVAETIFPETETFFAPYAWLRIGTVRLPKGLHELRMENVSGCLHVDCFVLTDDAAYVPSGDADRAIRGEAATRRAEGPAQLPALWTSDRTRNGVPLGGIGAGKIEICPDGVLTNITTNHNQDWPFNHVPGTFFALRQGAQARLLHGETRYGVTGVGAVEFSGGFPVARLLFREAGWPCQVAMTAFTALIPHDLDRSSLPAAHFHFSITNTGSAPVPVSLAMAWENLVGCGGWPLARPDMAAVAVRTKRGDVWALREGNGSADCALRGGHGLRLFGPARRKRTLTDGEYVIACSEDAAETSLWDAAEGGDAWACFRQGGLPRQAQPRQPAGALCVQRTLSPGETWTPRFVVAWHFPHLTDADGNPDGVYYTRRFPDAAAVADYALAHGAELLEETRALETTLCSGNLPAWQTRKLLDDLFPMVSCSWLTNDGRFSINEAPTGMGGCLGTLDQRNCSSAPYTHLFPQLDRRELLLFTDRQFADGNTVHDLGQASFTGGRRSTWPDLASAYVLECARYLRFTGDRAFLETVYPHVVRALQWEAAFDDDDDGIPDLKAGRGTTYDCYHWFGANSFVASLYAAALAEGAWLADLMRDEPFAGVCRKAQERVRHAAEARLWNGRYYRNYNDDRGPHGVCEDSMIAQLAGEYFADMAGMGPLWPAAHVDQAILEMFARNVAPWVAPADVVQPDSEPAGGGMGFLQYAEVYFGCLAIRRGYVAEGLRVFEQAAHVAYELGHHPWKTYLTYFARNGRGSHLCWYMTNPASWHLLEARSGFSVDAFSRTLRLGPRFLTGEASLCLPLFHPAGWLRATFTRSAANVTVELIPVRIFDPPALRFERLAWSPAPGRWQEMNTAVDLTQPQWMSL